MLRKCTTAHRQPENSCFRLSRLRKKPERQGQLLHQRSAQDVKRHLSFSELFQSSKKHSRKRQPFCIFNFYRRENKRVADELEVALELLDRANNEKYSFFYFDKPKKMMKKNFDEAI